MTEHEPRGRRFRRAAATLTAATVMIGTLAACDAAGGTSAAAAPSLRMVANGGHKLAFHVTSGHLPAIVLDAGGGADSSYWKDIVPVLAKDTGSEIITYDRAGSGASDEVPGPWKVEDAVSDLEAGLRDLGATKNVMLVSHSLAGEIATVFADKNPHWVTGAVLIDASLPEFATDSEVAKMVAANTAQAAELAKQPSTKETRQLLALAADYGPEHNAYQKLSWPSGIPATAIVSAKTPFDTPEDAQLWRDAQARFVSEAGNRTLVVAANSSHEIPVDRPDVVITAVEGMAKTLA